MKINSTTRLNQVKTALLGYFSENQLKRNDKLPSEATIAKNLGVSRNTLREAYLLLEGEGIIVRRHGIGTFIAQTPVIQDSLNEFFPFAQIIEEGGYTPRFETLSMAFVDAPADICEIMKVTCPTKIRCIDRIVMADRLPVIYVSDYIAPDYEKEIQNWENFDGNMVQFLTENLQTRLHQIKSSIRAAELPQNISRYLQIDQGTPVLSVRSKIYTVDNKIVNYSKIFFNSNIVELNTVRLIHPK